MSSASWPEPPSPGRSSERPGRSLRSSPVPVRPRPAVWCQGLAKGYGSRPAVQDVSLTLAAGEVVGLLGPNGAGKTTLVKLLTGLARPDAGEVLVFGASPGTPRARRRVGYLPELFRYQPWLSADEVVRLHGRLCGLSPDEQRAEGRRVLQLVGLGDRGRDRVAGFSKGMQQRLGLGVALIGRPDLLLLDEPTSALDPGGRADVRRLIDELRAAGTTILINSHLLSEVERSCDRVVVLNRGRVVADGTLDTWLGGDRVRVRLEQPAGEYARAPARWGAVAADGHDLTVAGVPARHVADVVAAVVAAGGRVTAVDAGHTSLEDRLLALLSDDKPSDDKPSDDKPSDDKPSDDKESRS